MTHRPAVATIWSPLVTELADITVPNRRRYAEKYRYEEAFVCHDEGPEPSDEQERHRRTWEYDLRKIDLVEQRLREGSPLVWYGDIDGMVTNPNVTLESIADAYPDHDVIVSLDCNSLNWGSFIVRNTPWAFDFIDTVHARIGHESVPGGNDNQWTFPPEGVLRDMGKVALVPQRVLNSYDYTQHSVGFRDRLGRNGQWRPGDFFIHWAGVYDHRRHSLPREMDRFLMNPSREQELRQFYPLWHCTDAMREPFLDTIKALASQFDPFNYVELGIAEAQTFYTVCKLLDESECNWTATGVDLEAGFNLHLPTVVQRLAMFADNRARLSLTGSQDYLHGERTDPIHFCFIDACHSKSCAMSDFLAVETFVPKGGVVCFHDSGNPEQGTDRQPHCDQPVGVRDAIHELGLLENNRKGWSLVQDVAPAHADDRGAVFVEKTADIVENPGT